jgi:rieske iron-sulfur protein
MKSKFSKERRDLLKSTLMLVGATALGTVGGSLPAFAAGGAGTQPQPPGSPQPHDIFVFNDGPKKGQDVKISDIVLNAPPISVQAKDPVTGKVRDSDHSTVLLYYVKPDTIGLDWRADSANGILAYSAECTYDATVMEPKDWDATNKLFVCPSCQSKYDPLKGAAPVAGPSKRELPQVPVGDDFDKPGYLFITHGVIDWIGIKRDR